MFFGGLVGSIGSRTVLPSEGVLLADMSTLAIVEQTSEANPIEGLQGGEMRTPVGILDATAALEAAACDPGVKFLYIKADGTMGGLAHLEEFRRAISRFRESGKPVIAYTENPGNGSYYIASAADRIYMTSCEGGMNTLTGLSSQLFFLKDILDRLGINVQLIRHGKYKSAGEMYIRNDISAENRSQYETFIGSIWNGFSSEIAESRGMSAEQFNSLLNDLKLNSPEDFLECGLVDSLFTREELHRQIANLCVTDRYKNVKFMNFADYAAVKAVPNYKAKEKIAVIYADGEIIDGREKMEVAGDRFAGIIADIRENDDVKAVVLRVNSPGGSVLASEKIRNEIELLREVKPVIASYGDYAASGGYWISNSCDRIFSDASTLTGSIGVFSMIPDLSKTAKDIAHVNIVAINSNKHGDMYNMMRPFDDKELAYMQESVENIYDRFTSIVSEGRSLDKDFVDSIAQGRVWAGSDAIGIGLVDEIGTLEDAIAYAASVADSENGSDLGNWQIVGYPKPLTIFEQLAGMLTGTAEEEVLSDTPFAGVGRAFKNFKTSANGQVYARLPYAMTIE